MLPDIGETYDRNTHIILSYTVYNCLPVHYFSFPFIQFLVLYLPQRAMAYLRTTSVAKLAEQ
jgi:hypothetical protein